MNTTKERPIIMSFESVKAILEDRKTQTRRVIKQQIKKEFYPGELLEYCPYGKAGNRLWVKETWATENRYNHLKPSEIPHTATIYYLASIDYDPFEMGIVRSSRFMPRWASRILLEITGVKVERLHYIEQKDIVAEGCPRLLITDRVDWFIALWDSLNAKRGYGWDTNPWVWVISFRRIK